VEVQRKTKKNLLVEHIKKILLINCPNFELYIFGYYPNLDFKLKNFI